MSRVKCDYQWPGQKTCLQVAHADLSHVCEPCAIRWDHTNGKHVINPEPDCKRCQRRIRKIAREN